MSRRSLAGLLLILVIALGVGLYPQLRQRFTAAVQSIPPVAQIVQPNTNIQLAASTIPVQPREVPQGRPQTLLSFAPVVKQVAPAVVNVYATTITQQSTSPFANDPFFGQLFGQNSPMMQSRPRESQSLGSGVIIDPSGIIITNSHVVNGATDVRVALQGGTEYPVDVLLNDSKTDLAVLRIKASGGKTFPSLKFANSDNLQVGDLVLAIGNPFGVGQTVTSGIVSALARTGIESSNYEAFIQTDAAINPGNSGGALVDLNGQLVGINTAIFSKSGGSVGIGFAIPANMARTVANAGVNGGKLVLPWLGARLQTVSSDIANSLNITPPHGALITEVAPGGPAQKAGLQSGDVIVSIDGTSIDEPQALNYRIATKPIGGTAELTYVRSGQQTTTQLPLEAAPQSGAGQTAQITGNTSFSGTTATALNPAVAQDLGLPFNAKGVVVTDVATGSPAEQIGLKPGDIVLNLNGANIADVGTFKRIASQGANGWQVVIQRDGQVIRSFIGG
ncbi:MAG: serine protease [Hyphomicrobiales bacterium]|nr:serine protease [Hyphomicrobiales bacterium]